MGDFPEGTGVGDKRNPSDPASQALDPKTKSSLRLRFRVRNCNGLPRVISETQVANANAEDNAGWDAVLWKGRLYVLVDSAQMTDSGSKEAFVALLEYAEEVLEVSHVIVCIDKTQSAATKMAIRNFLFLGFQPLAPGHEFLPTNPNLVCSCIPSDRIFPLFQPSLVIVQTIEMCPPKVTILKECRN